LCARRRHGTWADRDRLLPVRGVLGFTWITASAGGGSTDLVVGALGRGHVATRAAAPDLVTSFAGLLGGPTPSATVANRFWVLRFGSLLSRVPDGSQAARETPQMYSTNTKKTKSKKHKNTQKTHKHTEPTARKATLGPGPEQVRHPPPLSRHKPRSQLQPHQKQRTHRTRTSPELNWGAGVQRLGRRACLRRRGGEAVEGAHVAGVLRRDGMLGARVRAPQGGWHGEEP